MMGEHVKFAAIENYERDIERLTHEAEAAENRGEPIYARRLRNYIGHLHRAIHAEDDDPEPEV